MLIETCGTQVHIATWATLLPLSLASKVTIINLAVQLLLEKLSIQSLATYSASLNSNLCSLKF